MNKKEEIYEKLKEQRHFLLRMLESQDCRSINWMHVVRKAVECRSYYIIYKYLEDEEELPFE